MNVKRVLKRSIYNILLFSIIYLPISTFLVILLSTNLPSRYIFFLKGSKDILMIIFFIFSIIYILLFNKTKNYLDILIILFMINIIIVGIINNEPITKILYSIRYDVFFLIVFSVILKIDLTKAKTLILTKTFIYLVLFSSIAFLFIYIINNELLLQLGYHGGELTVRNVGSGIKYCQHIIHTDFCRFQSSFEGPNKYGFVLSIVIFSIVMLRENLLRKKYLNYAIYFLIGIFLLLTVSRSAWIIVFVFLLLNNIKNIKSIFRLYNNHKYKLLSIIIFVEIIILINISNFVKFFVRAESIRGHLELIYFPIKYLIEKPFGYGLFSSLGGTSSLYIGESYVITPENWFLHIGIQYGVIGLVLTIFIFYQIYKMIKDNIILKYYFISVLIGLMIFPIFISSVSAYLFAIIFGIHVKIYCLQRLDN